MSRGAVCCGQQSWVSRAAEPGSLLNLAKVVKTNNSGPQPGTFQHTAQCQLTATLAQGKRELAAKTAQYIAPPETVGVPVATHP